jgi:Asp/Glu/hydantoin racemase
MAKRLALLHTVGTLIPSFKSLCTELIPDVDLFNIVDESLLQNTIRSNQLTKTTIRRLCSYVISAQEAGADLVMVTCSSVGPAAEASRAFVDIPVYRVDEPMADYAVSIGKRIGVAATLSTTLEPTASLILARAAANHKEVRLVSKLCEGAFQAVTSGDPAKHDDIVRNGLRELIDQVDVIVLAQASMARVVDTLPDSEKRIPILSSPRMAIEFLAKVILNN